MRSRVQTFLGLHLGLLDHSEDVRVAAMEALQCMARCLLATFQCMVAESLEVVKAVLESGRGSNNQFEAWLKILRDVNKLDILRKVKFARLSKARRNMIDRVLAAESGTTSQYVLSGEWWAR